MSLFTKTELTFEDVEASVNILRIKELRARVSVIVSAVPHTEVLIVHRFMFFLFLLLIINNYYCHF